MKAVQITQPGQATVVELGKPRPEAHEVLLKVKYIGLCGSDLSSFLGKNPMVNYPVIPGHEIAAEIIEKGNLVPDELSIGQAVTVNPYTSCGTCSSCRAGRVNACKYNQTFGVQRNGALSEYICIPWQKIIRADALSDMELVLIEPLSVGFHAVNRGRVSSGEYTVVMGCGMIGAGAIIGALARGAQVIAVDLDDEKLELAKKLGAPFSINSKNEDLSEMLSDITGGFGPDVIIEAAGNPATYLAAIEESAFCGRVVCIGYAKADIALATRLFVQKELDILGSRNALEEDFRSVIAFLEKKRLQTDSLISAVVDLNETGNALKMWSEATGKIMKILVRI